MAGPSRLNKALWTNITELKLLNKEDAPVKFLFDKSPFGEDDDESIPEQSEYTIIGRVLPNSDIFRESAFQIEMKLTAKYPLEPPEVRFLTPIYHPNISIDGKFCHALLMKTARWKPNTTLVQVVKAIVEHIDHPDADYAIDHVIGKEYMESREEFNRKALSMVNKHKLPRY